VAMGSKVCRYVAHLGQRRGLFAYTPVNRVPPRRGGMWPQGAVYQSGRQWWVSQPANRVALARSFYRTDTRLSAVLLSLTELLEAVE
jgi:hypothetical protein